MHVIDEVFRILCRVPSSPAHINAECQGCQLPHYQTNTFGFPSQLLLLRNLTEYVIIIMFSSPSVMALIINYMQNRSQ